MVQFILWLKPNTKELRLNGKEYRLSVKWIKRITLLNNIRIMLTVGLLLLAYFAGMCEKNVALVISGIILGTQVIFLGLFYMFIPCEINKIIEK